MKIVLAGGSGSLGRALVERLAAEDHGVVVLSRRTSGPPLPAGVRRVAWVPDGTAGEWARDLAGADAIINLTGAGIADARWTRARKAELRSSRVLPTRSLVTAIRNAATRPAVFIQHCAVGYYGMDTGTQELDESYPPGDDFLSELAVAWEAEALPVANLGCRLVTTRTGVVLMADAGALPQMARPFRFFVGGPVASGRQYLSWIHLEDWVGLMVWLLRTPTVSGVVNVTAPQPVTNAEFSRAIGRALRRPSWAPVPAFVLRLLFGELADVLITGQRVIPRRAVDGGYTFRHPEIGEALIDLLRAPSATSAAGRA
jgi:hypothetical protein